MQHRNARDKKLFATRSPTQPLHTPRQMILGKMRIHHSSAYIFMPQQSLHGPQINSGHYKMGGKGVS